jgi:hypothetical protein
MYCNLSQYGINFGDRVMTLLIPAAFFTALDNGVSSTAASEAGAALVSDTMREKFLKISRGLAFILIAVFVVPLLSLLRNTQILLADTSAPGSSSKNRQGAAISRSQTAGSYLKSRGILYRNSTARSPRSVNGCALVCSSSRSGSWLILRNG